MNIPTTTIMPTAKRLATLATVAVGLSVSPVFAQQQGGTFIKAIENEPASLDYLFGKDFGALTTMTNIYNNLTRLDFDFNPTPELAESWTISDDGLTYTFQLRQGVTGTTACRSPLPMWNSLCGR